MTTPARSTTEQQQTAPPADSVRLNLHPDAVRAMLAAWRDPAPLPPALVNALRRHAADMRPEE